MVVHETVGTKPRKKAAPLPDTPMHKDLIKKGYRCVVFKEGRIRYINVASRLLLLNLDPTKREKVEQHLPVVCVRHKATPNEAFVFDEVEVLGACEIRYTPEDPLPGTNGRGIAYMTTKAALRAYVRPDRDSTSLREENLGK